MFPVGTAILFSIGWVFKKLRADHLAPRLHTKPSPAVHPPFPPALRLHPSSFRCGPVLASVVTGPSPLTPTDPAASVPAAVLLLLAFISAPPGLYFGSSQLGSLPGAVRPLWPCLSPVQRQSHLREGTWPVGQLCPHGPRPGTCNC